MTTDELIRLAHEAGIIPWNRLHWSTDQFVTIDEGMDGDLACLTQFAALIAAAEREACARVCEARYMGDNNREDMEARRCAAAIRARNT